MTDDVVHDPNRRQRYVFGRDGEDLLAEVWVEPGGDVPAHLHPAQEERFEVIAGNVRFTAGGRRVAAGPGDELVVPPKTWHSFRNTGETEAHLRVRVHPGLELQGFLEEAAALSRAGLYTRRGLPTGPRAAVRLAEFTERHRDGTVLRWPPAPLQRLMLRLARRG